MFGTDTNDGLGYATHVSSPGAPTDAPSNVTPGADGVGKSLAIHHAVIYLIAGAAIGLVAIGVVFRRPIGQSS